VGSKKSGPRFEPVLEKQILLKLVRVAIQPVRETRHSKKISQQQGCQIFLGATYQNGRKYTETGVNMLNGRKIYQMAVKLTKWSQI
jgi:hypothetical protein